MPLHYVQQTGQTIIVGGTQNMATFELTGPAVIELDPALFTQKGNYVLFVYVNSTYPGSYGSLQAAINDLVTVDSSDLVNMTVATSPSSPNGLLDDPYSKRITLTLI